MMEIIRIIRNYAGKWKTVFFHYTGVESVSLKLLTQCWMQQDNKSHHHTGPTAQHSEPRNTTANGVLCDVEWLL